MRHLLGRQRSGEQGPTPSWLPVPASVVPFVCGSVSGVCFTIRYMCAILTILAGYLMGSYLPLGCVSFHQQQNNINWAEMIFNLNFSVKTKVQQRSLAGERYRGPLETLHRLIRGINRLLRLRSSILNHDRPRS